MNQTNNHLNLKTLEDTVALMSSDYYEDQFLAEYHQLRMRYYRLRKKLEEADSDASVKLLSPKDIVMTQLVYMQRYMHLLEHRAELEGTEL